MQRNLVVGCGRRPKTGAVNLDIVKLPGVDVVHDIEKPLPFPERSFDHIEAEDVLEHVTDIVAVMEELWRVLDTNGTLWIRGPDARYPEQLWIDPAHKRGFVPHSFDNWDPDTKDGKHYGHQFGKARFKVLDEQEKNKGMEYLLRKIG